MERNELILHWAEGKYECPVCHRKFNVFNEKKKPSAERRTMSTHITNLANAERHLRACEKRIP